jgi:hypothetical protein
MEWNVNAKKRKKWGRISFSCRRNICKPVRDIARTEVSEGDENGLVLWISQRSTCHSGIIASPKTIKEDTLNIDLQNTQKTEFEDILPDTFA